MNLDQFVKPFDFTGKTAVITGGSGVLCSRMALALARCGARVAILDKDPQRGQGVIDGFGAPHGQHLSIPCDVLDRPAMEAASQAVMAAFGRVDFLINGAGGNHPKATTNLESAFFDIPLEAFRFVSELNLIGTVLPSQIFGKTMAQQKSGCILNITSMNALRPLTRIPAYSAAKAAISNFTQWLAVHMAQEYSPEIRVNAVAPGFFLTDQNRFLLTEKETGALTDRGRRILDHTPMARFGEPDDLLGATLWLLSPAAAFVTGIVVPVDGGFSAFSGV